MDRRKESWTEERRKSMSKKAKKWHKDIGFSKKVRIKLSKSKLGKKNPQYGKKRNRRIRRNGYIYLYVKNHPNKTKQGYIAEHRLIMEKKIGRYLKKEEQIHHINGIKDDNRIENLICLTKRKHMKGHSKLFLRDEKGRFKHD